MQLAPALAVLFASTLALAAKPATPRPPRTPVISQRYPKGRPPGYQGDSRCGPTSMAMVARAFRREPHLSDAALIDRLDRLDDGEVNRATAPAGILRMGAALRLRAKVRRGFDGAWLRRVLRRGGLVVALGRPRYLPPTEAHTGGHFVTIVGVTRKGQFIVNDPYRRTARTGHRYRVSEETLASFVRHKPNGQLFAFTPAPAPLQLARATATRRRATR